MRRGVYVVWMILFLANAPTAEGSGPSLDVSPPVGWRQAGGRSSSADMLISLRGPGAGAFQVARMATQPPRGDGPLARYLTLVLERLSAGARADYRSDGRLDTRRFPNGFTVRSIRAAAAGRPTLVVAVISTEEAAFLATLSSRSSSDGTLAALVNSLAISTRSSDARDTGIAVSADGQLAVSLGGGLRSRDLSPEEKSSGFVLSISGSGAEILIRKSGDDASTKNDPPAQVREAVARALGVPLDSVSAARPLATAAGPTGVYAWAQAPSGRYAAAFLPWSYWAYEAAARGPSADEFLVGAFAALKRGPNAVLRLVEATPHLAEGDILSNWNRRAALLGALAAALAALLTWRLRRKNANLHG